jgi:hypothetical protein
MGRLSDYSVTKIAEKGGLALVAGILASGDPTASVILQALKALTRLSRTRTPSSYSCMHEMALPLSSFLPLVENTEAVGELKAVGSLIHLIAHPNELLQMQVSNLCA